MSKQPGVMLYFDIRPSLARLTPAEKGALFEAILDYGQHGLTPQLEGMVGVAWDFIQPKLDRDRARYEEISQKRTAAIQARWNKYRAQQNDTNEYTSLPTTTPTTSTSSTSTSSSASASAPTPPPLTPDQAFNRRRKAALDRLDQYGAE